MDFTATYPEGTEKKSFSSPIKVTGDTLNINLKELEPNVYYLIDFGGKLIVKKRIDGVLEFYEVVE
jgi:hypothetical protein